EGQDQGLAVLVVPEADAGRLLVLHRSGGRRALAEVVVDAGRAQSSVVLLAEGGEELVGPREAAAGDPRPGAHGVDPLGVPRGLRLGQGVAAGAEVPEEVSPVAGRVLAAADEVAEVVGTAEGDGDAGDAPLAEVDLAVVVEILEDRAGQAGRRN